MQICRVVPQMKKNELFTSVSAGASRVTNHQKYNESKIHLCNV